MFSKPRRQNGGYCLAEFLQFWPVDDSIPEEPSRHTGREVNSVSAAARVIAEDVYTEADAISAEPNEPAPILLVRLQIAVVPAKLRQEHVNDHVAADAALV